MKKLIASVLIATATVPAFAWGDREQGALAGIVGTIILQNAMRNSQPMPPVAYPQPQVGYPQPPVVQHYPQGPVTVYPGPHPRVCYTAPEPRYDMYGNVHFIYRRVCQ